MRFAQVKDGGTDVPGVFVDNHTGHVVYRKLVAGFIPGAPPRIATDELYVRPDGSLFHFPIADDPESQTVSRGAKSGNTPERDIYLSKGMRFAKPEDVIAQRKKSKANEAVAEERRKSLNPLFPV